SPGGTYGNSYSYRPFGEALQSSETIANPFQFVGRFGVMHESNGLDFMRARFYSPVEGRFLTPDPIGLAGGQVNLYAYVGQDPVPRIDPSGQFVEIILSFGIGYLIGTIGRVFFDGKEFLDLWHLENESCAMGKAPNWEQCQWATHALKHNKMGLPLPRRPPSLGGDPPTPQTLTEEQVQIPIAQPKLAQPLAPNEKPGPAGFGADHFIAAESIVPYRIEFENEAAATAPAHRVVVTDQLDANLDWDTFAWTQVGFGDVVLATPAGSQHFQTTVPMTFNGRTFQVEIELAMNSQTGLLTAVFGSTHPATTRPPT